MTGTGDKVHGRLDTGPALTDAEIATLTAGDRVVVRRWIPATQARAAQFAEWLVGVAELHYWDRDSCWSLVSAWSDPPHRLDFVIGVTSGDMRTEVFREIRNGS